LFYKIVYHIAVHDLILASFFRRDETC